MAKGKFGEEGEVFKLAVFAKTGHKLFVFGDEAYRVACTNAWLEVENQDGKIIFAMPAVEVVAYH